MKTKIVHILIWHCRKICKILNWIILLNFHDVRPQLFKNCTRRAWGTWAADSAPLKSDRYCRAPGWAVARRCSWTPDLRTSNRETYASLHVSCHQRDRYWHELFRWSAKLSEPSTRPEPIGSSILLLPLFFITCWNFSRMPKNRTTGFK